MHSKVRKRIRKHDNYIKHIHVNLLKHVSILYFSYLLQLSMHANLRKRNAVRMRDASVYGRRTSANVFPVMKGTDSHVLVSILVLLVHFLSKYIKKRKTF